jgi:hypothetical protein
MNRRTKTINFGDIDHFLYVRIRCLCADLDYKNVRDFIEYAYYLLVELITEDGETQFWVLQDQYKEFQSFREKTRYAPRATELTHPFVVSHIHEEIYDHLVVIRKEHKFPWYVILRILYMVMQSKLDADDERIWKDIDRKQAIIDEFLSKKSSYAANSMKGQPNFEEESYQIKKTKKRYQYESEASVYPTSMYKEKIK